MKMCKIFLWVPESDHDKETISTIAQKIINYKKSIDNSDNHSTIKLIKGTKQGFNDAAKTEDGLEKAVKIYLKNHDYLLFLIDHDGIQSQAQRAKQKNSLLNKIERVVNKFPDKVSLIQIRQELEAWLLIDCLGICCYYTKSQNNRENPNWQRLAKKFQKGRTENIVEAESGGKGAKEYLEDFSEAILKQKNPNLNDKDIKKSKYQEKESPNIAKWIEINKQTLERNGSLIEFYKYLYLKIANQVESTDNS